MAQKNILNQVKTATGYDDLYPLTPYQVYQAKTVTGNGSNYAITIDLPAENITVPIIVSFTPNVANLANCTVSINGLASKPLYINNAPSLANVLGANDICLIQYNVNSDYSTLIMFSGALAKNGIYTANSVYHKINYTLAEEVQSINNYIPTMNSLSQDGFVITFENGENVTNSSTAYLLFSSEYADRGVVLENDTSMSRYRGVMKVSFPKKVLVKALKIYGKSVGYNRIEAGNADSTFTQNLEMTNVYGDYTVTINQEVTWVSFGFSDRTAIKKMNVDVDTVPPSDNNQLDLNLGFSEYKKGQRLSIQVPSSLNSRWSSKLQLDGLGYLPTPTLTLGTNTNLYYDGVQWQNDSK